MERKGGVFQSSKANSVTLARKWGGFIALYGETGMNMTCSKNG